MMIASMVLVRCSAWKIEYCGMVSMHPMTTPMAMASGIWSSPTANHNPLLLVSCDGAVACY